MILSHQKRFIFIHVPKVAGKSVKATLEPYSSRPYRINPYLLFPFYFKQFPRLFSGYYHAHVAAKNLKQKLPSSIYNNYFKFAFVRNPWDRMVSSYHYIGKSSNHWANPFVIDKSFKEFLRWRLFDNNDEPLYSQSHFLMDEENNCLVDFIGEFENLQNDFTFICNKISIPEVDLLKVNATNHRDYRSYYDEESASWVKEAFMVDIENFNYVY